jgi:hypothetical protein
MRRIITGRLSVALLGAALVAFLTGRLSAPGPRPQPPGCPYRLACPYCKGREAFEAGVPSNDNPFPYREDAKEAHRRWLQGWLDGQRTRPAQGDE